MLLDFIQVEFSDEGNPDINDLDALINGDPQFEATQYKPITVSADYIAHAEPSIYNEKLWTDVTLKDDTIRVCNQPYTMFKLRWMMALDLKTDETFEDLKSEDGDIKIRVFPN
jgi:hypothetical protein